MRSVCHLASCKMAAAARLIPLVDFSSCSLENEAVLTESDASVTKLAEELLEAFTTIGFVYLKGHGISEREISDIHNVGEQFFALPPEVKKNYQRSANENFGWVAFEGERLNPQRPADMKEAFNVTFVLQDNSQLLWPTKEVPDFKTRTLSFSSKCTELALRILRLIAVGLKLKDPECLVKTHQSIGCRGNATTLRLLHYPPLTNKELIKPGQVRCGEHSDYGSITLLFQDDVGGLEVLPVNGEYMAAKPIPGTVLVNIGDLMQRWTTDKLISTKHRVLVPEEELKCQTVRQSLAFFVHPDDDVVIECLDGSNTYPPITSLEYLQQRFAVSY